MLARHRVRIVFTLVCLALVGAGVSSALAGTRARPKAHSAAPGVLEPAAVCQPFSNRACLLPFPNNLYTVRDRSSATGLRVHLPAGAMPVSATGHPISVAPYDRNDGFSPGSAIIVHIAGLDNAAAFAKTNP